MMISAFQSQGKFASITVEGRAVAGGNGPPQSKSGVYCVKRKMHADGIYVKAREALLMMPPYMKRNKIIV